MGSKLALTLALGIFIGLFFLGGTLGYWMVTATKDAAERIATLDRALPLLTIGGFGSIWSLKQLFKRPNYLSYGGF